MEQYKKFLGWTRILAVFAAVFVADLVLKRLEEKGFSALAATTLLGLVAIMALHISEAGIVRLVETSSALRRIILGHQWIEGIWFDEVIGEGHFALVSISTVDGEVKVRGEQFDRNGHITTTWESCSSVLEGTTLRTIYRSSQFLDGTPKETSGMSTYVFTGKPSQAPDFYSGSFLDSAEDGRHCQIRGYRVLDKKLARRLMTHETRQVAMRELSQAGPQALGHAPRLATPA